MGQVNDTHNHLDLSSGYQELEMIDLLEQQRVLPNKCPGRDREDCVRDLIVAWSRKALHEKSKQGHWHNFLKNALDGSEDHLGRGAAHEFWHEINMHALRAQAVQDVETEFHAGRLTWEHCGRLIQEFPVRHQLDTYLEGQEDEGSYEEMEQQLQSWDDASDPSSGESEQEVSAALADDHTSSLGKPLSTEQQQEVADTHDRVRKLEQMLAEAKTLQHPRIVNMLEASLHEARTKARLAVGKDSAVAEALRSMHQQDQARFAQARAIQSKRRHAALAARATDAPPESKRQAKFFWQRVASSWQKNKKEHSAGALAFDFEKAFDTADLGAGKNNGGTAQHFKNRLDLFLRLVPKFDCLPDADLVNIERTFRKIDETMRLNNGARWGFMFRDDMKKLLSEFEQHKWQALPAWLHRHEKKIPKPDLLV